MKSPTEGLAPTRDEVLTPATWYLEAVYAGRDPATVPLAPDAWVVENGDNAGLGADDIRRRLAGRGATAPPTGASLGPTDLRWVVDAENGQAIACYTLAIPGLMTLLLHQRFRVHDGLIHEIEILFHGLEAGKSIWSPS